MPNAGNPELLTVDELASQYLRCGRRQAYELVRDGSIPGVIRLGSRSIRISRYAVEAWLHGEALAGASLSTKDDELTGASPLNNEQEATPNARNHTPTG